LNIIDLDPSELLQCTCGKNCAKNYENWLRVDEVIAMKRCAPCRSMCQKNNERWLTDKVIATIINRLTFWPTLYSSQCNVTMLCQESTPAYAEKKSSL